MEKVLERCLEIASDPYKAVEAWKEEHGKKVIGCFPMDIPEELVHAADMLPVIMWESNEPITLGHARIMPFNCALTRSIVDDAMKGRLRFLDGMIFCDTCLEARGLPFIIERNAPPPFLEIFYFPPLLKSPTAEEFLVQNIEKLKRKLEEFAGRSISGEDLSRSIEIYNRNRALLRELYELRRRKPGILSAREMQAVLRAGMLLPKEEHNRLLEELLRELSSREPAPDGKVRVVLAGYLCYAPRTDVLDLLEQLGAVVVDDTLYVGFRSIAADTPAGEDPLRALARRLASPVPPCPTKVDLERDWIEYIVETARRSGAQGVVTLIAKFCPPLINYYSEVRRKMVEAGIPEVMLELEHELISLEQIRTRLQAFMETVRGGG